MQTIPAQLGIGHRAEFSKILRRIFVPLIEKAQKNFVYTALRHGLTAGAVEVTDVPVGRHAPVAERAVRTLKEPANTLCVGLENVGLEPYGNGVTYLLNTVHRRITGTPTSKAQLCLLSRKI